MTLERPLGIGGRAAHEAVLDAARRGVAAVFGEEGELPPYEDDEAWAGRSIDGGWLAGALTGGDLDGRGLAIQGARIEGGLGLEGAQVPGRLTLARCQLGDHPIVLRDARTRTVDLDRIRCGPIDADRAHIAGGFRFHRSLVTGSVRMIDTRIDASIIGDSARIEAPHDVALNASGVRVGGGVMLRQFSSRGEMRLSRATIGADLNASGAKFDNHEGRVRRDKRGESAPGLRFDREGYSALRANAMEVGGYVVLGDGFEAVGDVQLMGARIGRDVIGADGRFLDPGGDAVSLDGAVVGGGVFMQRAEASGQVRLVNTTVGGDVRCGGARFSAPGQSALFASRAAITGNVFLDQEFVAEGQVWMPGATIGGRLRCVGATISVTEGPALNADTTHVRGGVELVDLRAQGQVLFFAATVGAAFDATGARLTAAPGGGDPDGGGPDGEAEAAILELRGAEIGRSLRLRGPFTADGPVRFAAATIGGDVDLGGARVSGSDRSTVHGSGARVGGNVVLDGGFSVAGAVRLAGIAVGRNVVVNDGTIAAGAGDALNLKGAQVTGSVYVRDGATIEGLLHLVGATVGGSVELDGARLRNPGRVVVDLGNARVGGAVMVRGAVDGQVRLSGASLGGDLDCRDTTLAAPADGIALKADRAQVTGGLVLSAGFGAEGEVRFRSCAVAGHASFWSARLSNPGGTALKLTTSRVGGGIAFYDAAVEGAATFVGTTVGNNLDCRRTRFTDAPGTALDAGGAHLTGGVELSGLQAEGAAVRLAGAVVGGDVCCDGATFADLDAVGAQVDGALVLADGFRATGAVVLRGATAGTLRDDAASWPAVVDLDGFRYGSLACPPEDRRWRARSRWLRRQAAPSAQGYVHLAGVYRSAGDELDARRILIERHNALLRPPAHWRPQLPAGPREALRRAWRWVLRLTIGHGFAPARSLFIAVPLVVGLALWVAHARDVDMLVATDDTAVTSERGAPTASECDDRYPCVQPLVYAIDNLVPIFEFGQRTRWAPDQSHRGATVFDNGRALALATWTTSALGWVLATLVAASFTQVVRRE